MRDLQTLQGYARLRLLSAPAGEPRPCCLSWRAHTAERPEAEGISRSLVSAGCLSADRSQILRAPRSLASCLCSVPEESLIDLFTSPCSPWAQLTLDRESVLASPVKMPQLEITDHWTHHSGYLKKRRSWSMWSLSWTRLTTSAHCPELQAVTSWNLHGSHGFQHCRQNIWPQKRSFSPLSCFTREEHPQRATSRHSVGSCWLGGVHRLSGLMVGTAYPWQEKWKGGGQGWWSSSKCSIWPCPLLA